MTYGPHALSLATMPGLGGGFNVLMLTVMRMVWRISVSAEGRRNEKPAVLPQIVVSARKMQRGFVPKVTIEDLAVVAYGFDDIVGPVGRQPKLLTKIVADTKKALHFRVGRILCDVINVFGGQTIFFCSNRRKANPAHQM